MTVLPIKVSSAMLRAARQWRWRFHDPQGLIELFGDRVTLSRELEQFMRRDAQRAAIDPGSATARQAT